MKAGGPTGGGGVTAVILCHGDPHTRATPTRMPASQPDPEDLIGNDGHEWHTTGVFTSREEVAILVVLSLALARRWHQTPSWPSMPSRTLAVRSPKAGCALQGIRFEGHREAQDDKTLALNAFKDPCPSLTKSRLCSARESTRGT